MAAYSDHNNYFVREIEKHDGSVLKVNQCHMGDVGCVVWDAAIVLAKYLETKLFHDPSLGVNLWAGRRVVELGAGTGVVGLMAATLGAHVSVTDLEDLQSLLNINIQDNHTLIHNGSITAKVLKCPSSISSTSAQSIAPLTETLKQLAGPETCIICCYEQRTEGINPKVERQFFELLQQSFHWEEIPLSKQDQEFSSPDIHILHIQKNQRL
ncbi:protein-lysine methyltransferase METTL21D isoform X2 [Nerophis ophidion]|uniref:protein-lysine methyltransferase METTL21D isoform X2 n=1 Tax=Nerophis ophidion TaxID=159077 RepID=UPI002ADF2AD9|nr:protein-lysine methyltransferase METTL21D isoform X2 [Nerophis ophidion]